MKIFSRIHDTIILDLWRCTVLDECLVEIFLLNSPARLSPFYYFIYFSLSLYLSLFWKLHYFFVHEKDEKEILMEYLFRI